ncbi:MAG: NAD-dependent epimerase/dehydratase family protein, partial [Actinomycetota bacterium]|nr:NAD-dependent epimerase/dehydratase family protein [Actinomycetota bacterium]
MTAGATRDTDGQTASGRVLVTGGEGFLGRHLCAALARAGAQVVSVDNLSTSAPRLSDPLKGVELVRHDMCRPLPAPWCDMHFDAVFHLACPASPTDYLRMPLATLRGGAAGTAVAL